MDTYSKTACASVACYALAKMVLAMPVAHLMNQNTSLCQQTLYLNDTDQSFGIFVKD